MIILHVPNPPSLNELWITIGRGRRVRSKKYSAWAVTAGWEVRRQYIGQPSIDCRYNMELQVPISRRDTGNWEKAISDLLQDVGVVTNDGNCHELAIKPMERTDCAVVLTPLPEMGGVRKAAKPRGLPKARKFKTKPSVSQVGKAEGLRARVRF